MTINAILDDGATLSMLSARVAKLLDLSGPIRRLLIGGITGTKNSIDSAEVPVLLSSTVGTEVIPHTINVIDNPVGDLYPANWNKLKHQFKHLEDIQFPDIDPSTPVEMVLGNDNPNLQERLRKISAATTRSQSLD